MPKIAKKPTQGAYYRIKKGDFLFRVAGRAYGNTRLWPLIWKSSRTKLRSGNPNIPFVGELVFCPFLKTKKSTPEIPAEPVQCTPALTGKDRDDFTLILEDRILPVKNARIIRPMDTAADGWTASIAWQPGADPELDELVKPYSYAKAGVYLGNTLMVCGKLYGVTPRNSTSGISKDLEGFSSTIDIVDSTIKTPYQQAKVSLLKRCQVLLERYGLTVEVSNDANVNSIFPRVTAKSDENIFSHLSKLAKQRGVLISSTRKGNLLLTQANLTGNIVDTLVEGQDFVVDLGSKFDGRARFSSYKAVAQGAKKKKKKTAVVIDPVVPGARFTTFRADDSSAAEVKQAALWARAKQLADALTISISVTGWYDKHEGKLWEENTLVWILSPTLDLPDGFVFLIKQVEYVFSPGGNTTTLAIVPPEVYTSKEFKDPWQTVEG